MQSSPWKMARWIAQPHAEASLHGTVVRKCDKLLATTVPCCLALEGGRGDPFVTKRDPNGIPDGSRRGPRLGPKKESFLDKDSYTSLGFGLIGKSSCRRLMKVLRT